MNSEKQNLSTAHRALKAWLSRWRPASPAENNSILKTTEAIMCELEDMVVVELAEVAEWMQQEGYSIVYEASGRHGWAIQRRDNPTPAEPTPSPSIGEGN